MQGDKPLASEATESSKEAEKTVDSGSEVLLERFEDTFKELQKWVEVKSSKYGILSVTREKHHGRLGTALKVFCIPFSFKSICIGCSIVSCSLEVCTDVSFFSSI